jgi:hypothetical protein
VAGLTRTFSDVESGSRTAQTFLVEHYWPGVTREGFLAATDRVRAVVDDMARTAEPVRFLHSTFVPEDESAFCVFSSPSRELVEEAYKQAGVPFERVLLALELEVHDGQVPDGNEER